MLLVPGAAPLSTTDGLMPATVSTMVLPAVHSETNPCRCTKSQGHRHVSTLLAAGRLVRTPLSPRTPKGHRCGTRRLIPAPSRARDEPVVRRLRSRIGLPRPARMLPGVLRFPPLGNLGR